MCLQCLSLFLIKVVLIIFYRNSCSLIDKLTHSFVWIIIHEMNFFMMMIDKSFRS